MKDTATKNAPVNVPQVTIGQPKPKPKRFDTTAVLEEMFRAANGSDKRILELYQDMGGD